VSDSRDSSDSPLDDAIADDNRAARKGRFGWISITVAVLFGLVFAYYLWVALSDLLAFPEQLFTGTKLIDKPWALLIVNLAVPVLAYFGALLLGRRRNVFVKAVFFAIGLTIVSVVSLDIPYLILL